MENNGNNNKNSDKKNESHFNNYNNRKLFNNNNHVQNIISCIKNSYSHYNINKIGWRYLNQFNRERYTCPMS